MDNECCVRMEAKAEKVYVAISRDSYDGFSTLQWALSKWSAPGTTIVILYGPYGFAKNYVYTPLGKLHVSSVSEEKLNALEKAEEAKRDKILSQYIAYCGKAKAEVIKLEENEQQPIEQQIVEIISSLRISKLVISIALMKSSSWKSRTAISRLFYVFRHKPVWCEVFVICGGRLVVVRDENDGGFVEDDRGVILARIKGRNRSIRTRLGKMFQENPAPTSPYFPSSSKANCPENPWMKFSRDVEQYANDLISLDEEDGEMIGVENGEKLMELHNLENSEAAVIQHKIQIAEDAVLLNKQRANAAKERGEKARWAISICNARVEELEACINTEAVKNIDLGRALDLRKEEIHELGSEIEEKRKKLTSVIELQKELSDKLNLSSSAKARAEIQLEQAVRERADMVQEIEQLRKHRAVLQQRIEFCKEKDAIVEAANSKGFGFDFREFSAAEIAAATDDFSERLRLNRTSVCTNIYKGRLYNIPVAIRVYEQANSLGSLEDFTTKAKLLSQLRHPNMVAIIGFCSELNCIVYEYMNNGSLHDVLKKNPSSLNWHTRIRIAAETCSGLAFLHKAHPKPIIHGNLEPSKILLNQYQVAKINVVKSPCPDDIPDITLDIRAFGNVLLQILTGKNCEERIDVETSNGDILDHLDGEWPMDLAMDLYSVAMRCLSSMLTVMPTGEIDDVKERADQILAKGDYNNPLATVPVEDETPSNMLGAFLCPIYQEVMKNPHLAADGFSYEYEAIEEWLSSGHDTSPMTNLRLKHKLLTPNHALRSLIQDWQNRPSSAAST